MNRRSLAVYFCAALVGMSCFAVFRWIPGILFSKFHTPSEPIAIARIFPPDIDPETPRIDTEQWRAEFLPLNTPQETLAYSLRFMDKLFVGSTSLLALPFDAFPSARSRFGSLAVVGTDLHRYVASHDWTTPGEPPLAHEASGHSSKLETLVNLSRYIPHILIRIPTEMNVSRNGSVTAELDPMKSALTNEMRTPPQLIVVPSVFDVAGPSRPNDLSWTWDVYPKAIGNGRSITLQFPATAKFDFKIANTGGENIVVSGNTVTATVDVRDELGLTLAERTLATAFASAIAIVGTVFAFPFIKGKLEPKMPTSATVESRPAPTPEPAPKIAKPKTRRNRKRRRKPRLRN